MLEFEHVYKYFPGVTALRDVSFSIEQHSIHGLCGENGAGKSTLMKILSGVYPAGSYEGAIHFSGEELHFQSGAIRQSIERGIAIVYQELTLVPKLTVGENIYLGREPHRSGVIDWDRLYSDTAALLERYKLDISPNAPIFELGVGHQQMVEIAKALSLDAKLLILDEPTSALSEQEIAKLHEILRGLEMHGVTCIYITHRLEELFQITEQVTVLRDGEVVDTRPTTELTMDALIAMMVGREMKKRFPDAERSPGEVMLSIRDVRVVASDNPNMTIIGNASFDLHKGEVLGIAGLMGSGRTELVTALIGEQGTVVAGDIFVRGKRVEIGSAREAIQLGIALVPEDRKNQGIILIQSLLQNISLANLNQFASFMRIDVARELSEARKYGDRLQIKAPNLQVLANTLSGGNQQKVVIAKALMAEPLVLILDDPTRGIDVGAKFEIYTLINSLAAAGVAIILISSELEEVIGMSDRILVLHSGRTVALLGRDEVDQETIMRYATGLHEEKEKSTQDSGL